MTGMGLRMLTCAEPETPGEATLTAVTVTVLVVGMVAGGVYTPPDEIVPTVLLPPGTVFTSQFTAVLVALVTVAVKVTVLPRRAWLAPATVTVGGDWLLLEEIDDPQPVTRVARPRKDTRARSDRGNNRESCKAGPPRNWSRSGDQGKAVQTHTHINQG